MIIENIQVDPICFRFMAKISEICKETHNRIFSLEFRPQNIFRSNDDLKRFFHDLFHNHVVFKIIGKNWLSIQYKQPLKGSFIGLKRVFFFFFFFFFFF